jgi:pimeloyl-ACP methyl ester carboxylesterase
MSTVPLLPGITQHKIRTDRLEVAYLEAGSGNTPVVLVHGNTSSSLFFQDFMLLLTATNRYKIYAPDLRGFGDTEALPIDATRGLHDFSDDLYSLTQALGLTSFHLFGWSLGGNVVMQYAVFEFGFLGQLGAVPGWPGAEVYPPQPMITQIHTVMNNYAANGGEYSEVVLPDCGHSPHIEKQDTVFELVDAFIQKHDGE